MYKRRARVLFLGTGAGGCAQMADGWGRHLGGEWLETRCAGLALCGANPHATAVMLEAGIDISRHACTHVTDALLAWADLVVTLGDDARAACPPLPPGTQKKHWAVIDPAQTTGSEAQVMAVYRMACEAAHGYVVSMIGGMRMLARAHAQDGDDARA